MRLRIAGVVACVGLLLLGACGESDRPRGGGGAGGAGGSGTGGAAGEGGTGGVGGSDATGGSGGGDGTGGSGGEGGSDGGTIRFIRSAGANPDLLFHVSADGRQLFFEGEEAGGALDPALVKIEHEDEALSTLVLDASLRPIQWMTTGVTLHIRKHADDADFDPAHAQAIIGDGLGDEALEEGQVIDMRPGNPAAALDWLEQREETSFTGARAYLANEGADFEQWVEKARTPGDDQPRHVTAVVAWNMAFTLMGIEEAVSMSTNDFHPSLSQAAKPLAKMGAAMMGSLLGDALGPQPPDDPEVPTVGALLCQGASSVAAVCHYMFFVGSSPFPCVDLCLTNLGCFNGICEPTQITLDQANQVRGRR